MGFEGKKNEERQKRKVKKDIREGKDSAALYFSVLRFVAFGFTPEGKTKVEV